MERHGLTRGGRSAPGGASLPRFPFGDLILFSPRAFPTAFLLRSFPMTGSSCSAHPVSFPNVFQRQPLLCPWPFKTIYSVKIAGPENDVSGWMSSSVRNQSKKWESNTAMVTQRLAALRSHGSRFWGFGEAIKPRYLPVLENTCPQPTSVQERLSPRLYSLWSKT